MGLHSIIEPAGTLLTGWDLVPDKSADLIDVRNRDHAAPTDATGGNRTPVDGTASKWEQVAPGSVEDLGKVGQRRVPEPAPDL